MYAAACPSSVLNAWTVIGGGTTDEISAAKTSPPGSLVSSTYEQTNGKGKKAKTATILSWSIRADVVRKLDRGEPEAVACGATASDEAVSGTEAAPF